MARAMDQVDKLASAFVDDYLVSIELEDGGTFKVQSALLHGTSAYFRSALNGGYKESLTRRLRIPGCSTELFKLVLYWVCYSKLPNLAPEVDSELDAHSSFRTDTPDQLQKILVGLWLAADMLLMGALQNETIRCLRGVTKTALFSPDAVSLAFSNAAPDSPLVRALLQQAGNDFLNAKVRYSASDHDAFGRIPGFNVALFASLRPCDEFDIEDECHEHVLFNIGTDDDKAFYVKSSSTRD